ncbi:hypothetical protein MRB53_030117 [Persea americana]|uniref:Uncharacterized protein n=1 Tax=Persea americana TaxID=3435 RepID=A0ACC2KKN1_PERAE|nr:hypothetical protein MRB53_030117 [Persea americana]
MSWNGSSERERVMPMELAIRRELAFRTQRGQSLQQLEFPNQNSPPSPPLPAAASMVDSLLCERGLERRRLRDAAMELACSRTTRPTIPVEIAMQRETAFRRRVEGTEIRGLEEWPLMQCSGEPAQSSASSFGARELLPYGDLSSGKKQADSACSLPQLTYTAHTPNNHQLPSNQQGIGHRSSSLLQATYTEHTPNNHQLPSNQQEVGQSACVLLQPTYTAHAPNNHQLPSNQQGVGLFCELCRVSCMSLFNLHQHRRGKHHKAQEERLNYLRMKQTQKFWCDLCGISCIDMTSLEQHRAGKKHARQICQRQGGSRYN